MEIKYSNCTLDSKIYGSNEIIAFVDMEDKFLSNNISDLKNYTSHSKLPIGLFLKFGASIKMRKLIFDMQSELEINAPLQNRRLDKLSMSELLKVLIIKICSSRAKVIILESLDTYFNYKDMIQIIKTIKNHIVEMNKTVILTMNKVDNLIQYADRYIVVEDGDIVYNGKDFTKIPIPTDIKSFTDLANKKGAKLKEANDLLKAIYRSIK